MSELQIPLVLLSFLSYVFCANAACNLNSLNVLNKNIIINDCADSNFLEFSKGFEIIEDLYYNNIDSGFFFKVQGGSTIASALVNVAQNSRQNNAGMYFISAIGKNAENISLKFNGSLNFNLPNNIDPKDLVFYFKRLGFAKKVSYKKDSKNGLTVDIKTDFLSNPSFTTFASNFNLPEPVGFEDLGTINKSLQSILGLLKESAVVPSISKKDIIKISLSAFISKISEEYKKKDKVIYDDFDSCLYSYLKNANTWFNQYFSLKLDSVDQVHSQFLDCSKPHSFNALNSIDQVLNKNDSFVSHQPANVQKKNEKIEPCVNKQELNQFNDFHVPVEDLQMTKPAESIVSTPPDLEKEKKKLTVETKTKVAAKIPAKAGSNGKVATSTKTSFTYWYAAGGAVVVTVAVAVYVFIF